MGGGVMKYFRVDMYTIFDGCDYSLAFAFADDISEEEIAAEIGVQFDAYLCAFSKLLGDPASYSGIDEYDQVMDYYARNTDYKITPITQEEFLNFENSDRVEI